MILNRLSWNQKGDTIVEVLIATAIISSVLAGAFLVVQKSSIAVRDSQEHSEMLQLLQSQVELVRSRALTLTDNTSDIYNGTYFCMDNSVPATPVPRNFSTGWTPPALDGDGYGGYPSQCRNIQNYYNVAMHYDSTTKTFIFYGRWDSLSGIKDQETLVYRVQP